jgi:hypothetical protein
MGSDKEEEQGGHPRGGGDRGCLARLGFGGPEKSKPEVRHAYWERGKRNKI